MTPATVRHLRPVPDQQTGTVTLTKAPPPGGRWRRLARRRPPLPPVGRASRAAARHTGYSAAGTWRGLGAGWRWVVAADLAAKIDTQTGTVLDERARRRRVAGWGGVAGMVLVVQVGAVWWPLLPMAAIVAFVVAGVAERARQGAADETGRPTAGKKPGSKVVRGAFAAAKVGRLDDIRVIGPIVRDADIAWTGLVELPPGVTAQQAIKKLPNIAGALGVDATQLALDPVRGHTGRVLAWCADTDPLAGDSIPSPLIRAEKFDIWRDKIPLLFDVRGRPVSMSLVERSILVGGEPGGGKSVACNNILTAMALDPTVRLWMADGKGVDLLDFEDLCERFLAKPDPHALRSMLEYAVEEMECRYEVMARHRVKKITADVAAQLGIHPTLLHIDELAYFTRSKLGDDITELLRDFVSRGRAALMMLSAATQRPSREVVNPDLRDLIPMRMSVRCSTPESSDMTLGRGWAAQGFSAAGFDPMQKGAALLLAEGALPVRGRSGLLTDAQVTALTRRAYRLREAAGTLPVSDARHIVRLLRAVLSAFGEADKAWTADLLDGIRRRDEFADLTADDLAAALRPYGVRPAGQWIDGKNRNGYAREEVEKALQRA